MYSFLSQLFDTRDFPARWYCGLWSGGLGWLHIFSDIAIFGAYAAIPVTLVYLVRKRQDVPFPPIFWLFAVFIFSCGFGHLIEATIFWQPWYRLSGAVKLVTASVSWLTVVALVKVMPAALALPGLARVNVELEREIVERRHVEEELRHSEEQFRMLVEGIPDYAILMLDPDGRIMTWNLGGERLKGYKAKEIVGRDSSVFYPPDAIEAGEPERDLAVAAERGSHATEGWRVAKGGRVFWAGITTTAIRDDSGQLRGFAQISHDLSEHRRIEERQRQNEQRFRALVDASAQIVWTTAGNGDVVDDSPSWRAFTGQTFEQWRGPERHDAYHPGDRDRIAALWRHAVATRAPFETEYRLRRKDGEWRWTAARSIPLPDDDGTVREWVGMITDITERKRSMELFRLGIEAAPTGMLMTDRAGTIRLVNAQVEKLFGYCREELIGKPVEILIPERFRRVHPGHRAGFADRPQSRPMGAGRDLHALRKDGVEVPVEIGLNPIQTEDGDFVLSSVVDITDRKRAEQERELWTAQLKTLNADLEERVLSRTIELTGALREREVLLQEIHHRVKNNLQVISSLINLQVKKLEDAASRDALEECKTRIQAIALIHEKLYQSKDYSRVAFRDYARSLVSNVFQTTDVSLSTVSLDLAIDDVAVAFDKAIPCGLVLNELITNSLKHGFADGRSGTICVEFSRLEGGRCRLAVKDNGVGLPEGFDIATSESLGLQLVSTLARQLNAELEVTSREGTLVQLTFAAEG